MRPRLDDMPDLVTVDDTAAWFGCAPQTVRRMIRDGRLPRVKVGRLDRVPRRALEALEREARTVRSRS
jgi:excisionase family DNA binding protein